MKKYNFVGNFFHIFEREYNGMKPIKNQGRILNKVSQDCYLVVLYSFLDGRPNGMKIVRVDEMLDWAFYQTQDEMIAYWDRTCEYTRANSYAPSLIQNPIQIAREARKKAALEASNTLTSSQISAMP